MKKTVRNGLSLVLCFCALLSLTVPAFGTYMPDVTADMTSPSYWTQLQADPSAVLMTPEEIAAQNAANIAAKGTNMYDLKNLPETIDGLSQRDALLRSGKADAEYYHGWTYRSDGSAADAAFYEAMVRNMIDPNASAEQPIRYAVAVNRTTLHTFPSNEQILDDPADPEFDYQHLTGVRVNEPLAIYAASADGAFYLVRSVCCPGWVPAEDVAVCTDKEQWLDAWDFAAEDTLVVWGTYTTAVSQVAPELSRRLLTQGTTLQLVELEDRNTLVNNRAAYNNHVVWMPVRKDDGSYAKKLCLIAQRAEASVGYLPMTQENITKVAFAVLGDAYGWGGMMLAEDCSGYVRNVYKCFGMELARNTNWQQKMPLFQLNLTGVPEAKKIAAIQALPLGATLFFNGHEMLYLGCVDDKLYVVSAVSSIMNPDADGKRQRARDVMINTLDIKRANGKTWLQDINAADVPYYPADTGVLVPVESEHGTSSFTPLIAKPGTTVTAEAQPDSGYAFRSLTLKDANGEATTITDLTFPMPAGIHHVQATFEPQEPEDVTPTEPTQPTNPTEPTQPTNPTEPTQPTNPTEPTQPTNPTEPTEPTNPTEPTTPDKPTTPDVPTPAQPTTPVEPTPAQPTTPDEPTPAQPDKPDQADQPTTPDQPDKPDTPDKPDEPKQPCDGGENCPSKVFTDVDRSADSWYHEAVDWAFTSKVTDGMTDTTFAPDAACTRAQAVTFLWRANGSPEPKTTKNPFADVASDAYYYKAVLWAVENGITDGTTDTTFSPNDTCNRAHIVTFLFRSEQGTAGIGNPFLDVSAGKWYTEAVLWAVANGITDGVDETHFAPMSDCTRAHIVTFLYRDIAK